MSRHVAKISVCFQGFQIVVGGSTRHGRDMISLPPPLPRLSDFGFAWWELDTLRRN
jgi:hypothetical protein